MWELRISKLIFFELFEPLHFFGKSLCAPRDMYTFFVKLITLDSSQKLRCLKPSLISFNTSSLFHEEEPIFFKVLPDYVKSTEGNLFIFESIYLGP